MVNIAGINIVACPTCFAAILSTSDQEKHNAWHNMTFTAIDITAS